MTVTPGIQATLGRYQHEIVEAMEAALQRHSQNAVPTEAPDLAAFYGQMRYHLGWVDSAFLPIPKRTGKLLRPTLLLLAYEAAGSWNLPPDTHLARALPAAVALELTHNFTLIHDDIVDNDTERHHRPTLWTIWGSSQGINTGDGMFSLGRLVLWDCLEQGVEGGIAARVAALLDRSCLIIAEGQYLDLSFENRQDISVNLYLDMISRKTAALMRCSTEIGAVLGTREAATIASLRDFGLEIGIAFQVRDDLLGVWASKGESGKTEAGDIYRRKRSLPILHALEHADTRDQQILEQIYRQETPVTARQAATVLDIFASTGTREYCLNFLQERSERARQALRKVPRLEQLTAERAMADLEMLIDFVEMPGKA